jgi:hypothetical protein
MAEVILSLQKMDNQQYPGGSYPDYEVEFKYPSKWNERPGIEAFPPRP